MPDYYQSQFTGEQIDEGIGQILDGTLAELTKTASEAADQSDFALKEALISEHNAQVWAEGGQLEPHNDELTAMVLTAGAKQYAEQAEEAIKHAPKITNGTWWVWDATLITPAYVDTGVAATGPAYTLTEADKQAIVDATLASLTNLDAIAY